MKKRITKTKEEILKKVEDSIMIVEIANEDIEEIAKSVKNPDEAVATVNYMDKNY